MHYHAQNAQENPRTASLGVAVAGLGLGIGVASFVLGCTGFSGVATVGMFLAMTVVIAGFGVHAHATPDSPHHLRPPSS